MSYAAVDDIIGAWADASGLTLFVEWAGAEARFAYLSSPRGECYQISIEPPAKDDLVKVHARAIETLDDMEAHLEWCVDATNLRAALETAEATVRDCLWRRIPLR